MTLDLSDVLMNEKFNHAPVLLSEVIGQLITNRSGLYLDATVGLGGHSESIMMTLSQDGRLLVMDMDPEALDHARERLKAYKDRIRLVQANFRNLGQTLEREKFFPLTGALFDLGVSSLQLDKRSRGFSLYGEGPLDMRM